MPSFAEIIAAVTDFISTNIVLVAGAAVAGLIAAVFARLVRTAR